MSQSVALPVAKTVEEDGYAVIPNIFAADEMQSLWADIAATRIPRTRAGIRHLLGHPTVGALVNDPRLMEIAKEILGPDALPFHATLFDKSPDANWLVVWHQDTALSLTEKRDVPGWGPWSVKDGITYAHAPAHALEQVLAIRIHLDDSNLDNGPLRVLAGTHSRGVLSEKEIEQVSGEISSVSCTVQRGGLILMRPLLVHASSKSTSDASRRVLHVEYASGSSFDGLKLALT